VGFNEIHFEENRGRGGAWFGIETRPSVKKKREQNTEDGRSLKEKYPKKATKAEFLG